MMRIFFFFICVHLGFVGLSQAQSDTLQLQAFPAHLQLYARDAQDSATVPVQGKVLQEGFSTIELKVFQNDTLWKDLQQTLAYQNGQADFSFEPKIYAGLYECRFELWLDGHTLAACEDSIVCGDVFLINGQSNSHPNASEYDFNSEFCRSFGKHTNYDDYDPADTTWGLSTPRGWCNDCYFAVGTWGLRLQELILKEFNMPTCIINGGSGGSTISYNLPDTTDRMNLSTTYGRLLYRATKAHVADHVKAIFWHQGESDSYETESSYYAARFDTLYNAWHQDYAPLQKVYVYQLHPGTCGGDYQHKVREIQRQFKQTYDDVEVMSTVGLVGHDGCHYNDDGYLEMAQWLFRLIARDFYGSTDTANIDAPDIRAVYYQDGGHTSIAIDYDLPVTWPDDTLSASMENYFYLDDSYGNVQRGYTINDGYTVILELKNASNANLLTYLPNSTYNRLPTKAYEGPWIRGMRGVGALSFYHVPIGEPSAIRAKVPKTPELLQCYPNPFNASTQIVFRVNKSGLITLTIFDLNGRKIKTLIKGKKNAGQYQIVWDGRNEKGITVSSGTYYVRLKTVDKEIMRKVVLVK